MDINETAFPQQEAPEKNTDRAFVQVGKDGQPVTPPAADESANGHQPEWPADKEPGRK